VLFVKAGPRSLQFHRSKDEAWLIQSGNAKVETTILEISTPHLDDVVRLEDAYGEGTPEP
jgi:hypothetical protein